MKRIRIEEDALVEELRKLDAENAAIHSLLAEIGQRRNNVWGRLQELYKFDIHQPAGVDISTGELVLPEAKPDEPVDEDKAAAMAEALAEDSDLPVGEVDPATVVVPPPEDEAVPVEEEAE